MGDDVADMVGIVAYSRSGDPFHILKLVQAVKDVGNQAGSIKPWGREIKWADVRGEYTAKILHIKRGHRLSKQYHKQKEESMLVLSGKLHLEYANHLLILQPGGSVHIPPGTVHRPSATDEDVFILEISTWDDGDVVRLEDDYGRECATV